MPDKGITRTIKFQKQIIIDEAILIAPQPLKLNIY